MVGPWLHSLWKRGGGKLSDIEYLSIKEFDGKLVKNEGFLSATGNLSTLTAGSGDMYLARAVVNFFSNANANSTTVTEVVLKINNTIVETTKLGLGAANVYEQYVFKNIGHKVTTGQIIKLEVISIATQVDVEGFVECFEEATGASPAIN